MSISSKLEGLLIDWLLGKLNAPVVLQDQATTMFDLYLTKEKSGSYALYSAIVADTRTMEIAQPQTFVANDFAFIFDGESAQQLRVVSVAVDTPVAGIDTITVDAPFDKDYQTNNTEIYEETRDMNVNGPLGTDAREVFRVPAPILGTTPAVLDITSITCFIADAAAMDDGLFGSLAALANGCVFRKVDASGEITTYFTFRANGDFSQIACDSQYTDKAPSGENGFRARVCFSGQENHGVVVRINPGDRLELLVQDNLTGLSIFRASVSGHITN